MEDNTVPPIDRERFYGRSSTDPEVQREVARILREMPFRDLVARIEGEEAAAAMERENGAKSDEAPKDVVPVVPPSSHQ